MTIKEIFSARLTKATKNRKLSGKALAALTTRKGFPVAQNTIHQYLAGKRGANVEKALALAYTLEYPLDWLCGLTDNEEFSPGMKRRMLAMLRGTKRKDRQK